MTKRPNPSAIQSNIDHWDKIVKRFPLSDKCMVLTITGTSVGHPKNMQDMTNAIARAGWKDVVVGSVQSFDHIQVLNEQKMAEVGWVRQERIGFRMAIALTYARTLRWIAGMLKRKPKNGKQPVS
jgi:hypothetical protein